MVKGGGKKRAIIRVLTPEGRKYKTETTAYLVQHYPQLISSFKRNVPFGYIVQLISPNVYNSTWPKEAENRYKKFDALNRSKLLQDCFSEAFGIDDSVFLSTRFDKEPGPEERTNIWVWNMEEESPYSGTAGSVQSH